MSLLTDLVSAWELNEAGGDALDSHGGLTLTDHGSVGGGTGLVYGTARDFESDIPQYLSHADAAALSTGNIDFAFEAWVKPESFAGGGNARIIVGKDTDTGRDYSLELLNNVPRFGINGHSASVSWGAGLSAGTWYQLIGWHDAAADELGITVNAASPVTASTGGTAPNDTGTEFNIGARRYPGYNDPFDGLIGPVRFWKRVPTGGERTQLYNGGAGTTYADFSPPPPPPPPPPPASTCRRNPHLGFGLRL